MRALLYVRGFWIAVFFLHEGGYRRLHCLVIWNESPPLALIFTKIALEFPPRFVQKVTVIKCDRLLPQLWCSFYVQGWDQSLTALVKKLCQILTSDPQAPLHKGPKETLKEQSTFFLPLVSLCCQCCDCTARFSMIAVKMKCTIPKCITLIIYIYIFQNSINDVSHWDSDMACCVLGLLNTKYTTK